MNEIIRISCGNVNCYVIKNKKNAILIDTGRIKYTDKVLSICKDNHVNLIILTHGHADHIQNTAYLLKSLQIPVAMHQADEPLISNQLLHPLSSSGILGKAVLAASNKSFQYDKIEPF